MGFASPPLTFLLNGRTAEIDRPDGTLLDYLRAHHLTGAKEGCAEGECGACTVAMIVNHDGGSAYRAINSCLVFLPMAADREFYTVESLADDGRLSPAQEAMAAAGGSQCGYCTPGFVMSLFAEQYRPDRTGPCDPMALAGNLCRCTGYRPIRDAALALGPAPRDRFQARLATPARRLGAVATDTFSRPSTIGECVALLERDPGAMLVAGASDLAVDWNLRWRRARHLVSVEAIDELAELDDGHERVRIGAGLPLADVARRWPGAPPVVGEWLELFASPPIRNRATLGGNLATASPVGDAAPLLLALDASVQVAGPHGRRRVPLASFFTGYRRTVLGRGEVLTAVDIPKPLPRVVRFYKVARRRLDDISTCAAGMALDLDAAGHVSRARFAFGGVAATPVCIDAAEQAVVGRPWNEEAVWRVQQAIEHAIAPITDHRGSKAFRLEVAKRLVAKFSWELRS